MECYTCKSISGERRISPGPIIYEGEHWYVEHAYPVRMKGWLVLVLKRHVEALHELTPEECEEMGVLHGKMARLLHAEMGSQKEYAMCFAEADNFNHVHVHLVARAADLPHDIRGARIFAMLKTDEAGPLPPEEISAFCEHLKAVLQQESMT